MRTPLFLLIVMLLLIGCGANVPDEPSEPPSAAQVPDNTPTPLPPTAEPPTATATAVPTEPPTNTPTAEPTVPPTEPPPTPTATATAVPDVPRFSIEGELAIYGEEAAVPNTVTGSYSNQFADPGGAVFHDGQFHMLHNVFTGWPAAVNVMYSVSDDGITWTLANEEPVFEGETLDYVDIAALASSVVVRDDGTWLLYFYTWDARTWPVAPSSIGVATAPSPAGPWTAEPEPILVPGEAGEWDDLAVRTPSVLQTEDGFVMFYSGHQEDTARIGQAFSEDGLTWTKFDDPTTADAPFSGSDPIFAGSGSGWDRAHVYQPRVRQTADGWVMLYTSAQRVSGNTLLQSHGLALSVDGEEWVRSETAVLQPREVKTSGQNIWFTELVFAQDNYFIYLELGVGNETEIYVATFGSSQLPQD